MPYKDPVKAKENAKARYIKNAESRKAKVKVYYLAHSKEIKAKVKAYRYKPENLVRAHQRDRVRYRENPSFHILANSKRRAKKNGHAPIMADEIEVGLWLDLKSDSCRSCGQIKKLCLDHCHKTGKIRGWICNTCNMFAGAVENGRISEVQKYLESSL
jgi:hypothetical protein